VSECFDIQMIHVCVELSPSCPLLLFSKPHADQDVILGVVYMPKVSILSRVRSKHVSFRFLVLLYFHQ